MIAIHLGKDKNNHVIGKSIILETKYLNEIHLNNAEICQIIKKKITEIYGSKRFQIQVIGDSARWIKRIAKMLNYTYILDRFHLEKMAFSTFGYSKYNTINKKIFQDLSSNGITFCKKVMSFLYENKFDKVIEYLQAFISNYRNIYLSNKKINEILHFTKYIINNQEGIENYQNKSYIGTLNRTIYLSCNQEKKY